MNEKDILILKSQLVAKFMLDSKHNLPPYCVYFKYEGQHYFALNFSKFKFTPDISDNHFFKWNDGFQLVEKDKKLVSAFKKAVKGKDPVAFYLDVE